MRSSWSARTQILSIVLLLALGTTACAGPESPESRGSGTGAADGGEPRYGDILALGTFGDPSAGFDTMRVTNYTLSIPGPAIYGARNLVKPCQEDDSQVCPGLAERWESNQDFTQWTFKVRDGVLWHNGQPFTAEDAKFWFELSVFGARSGDKVRAPSISNAQFGPVKELEVLPGNAVRVTLGRPAPIFPTLLAMFYPLLIQHPKHLMQPAIDKGEVNVSPQDIGYVGTGPFTMHSYEKGSALQFRRFDRYWEKDDKALQLPFLDGIDYIIFSDPVAMDAAFRTGRLDGGVRAPPYTLSRERRAAYERSLGDKVWFAEIGGGAGGPKVGFNVQRPGPVQDVRVRRAISLGTDRYQAIEALGQGPETPGGFLTPPWENPDLASWPGYNKATQQQDRAEARRLLQEAGYAGGLKLRYMCWRTWVNQCELLAGQLAPLGIQLELDIQDSANWREASKLANWDLAEATTGRDYPESLEVNITTRSLTGATQVVHEDAKVADFFGRLSRTGKFEERQAIFRELERYMLRDQVYMVVTFSSFIVVPYRSHVKGMYVPRNSPPNHADFATVWLDK